MQTPDFVHISEPDEIQAVIDGTLKGEIYTDGEVWADARELAMFRDQRAATKGDPLCP